MNVRIGDYVDVKCNPPGIRIWLPGIITKLYPKDHWFWKDHPIFWGLVYVKFMIPTTCQRFENHKDIITEIAPPTRFKDKQYELVGYTDVHSNGRC